MDDLQKVRSMRPDRCPNTGRYRYRTGALFNDDYEDCIDVARRVGADEIHLRYDTCTAGLVRSIHDSGFRSMAWFRGPVGMDHDCRTKYHDVGNEDEAMYEALLRTGVQEMCINRPDVLLRLREKLLQQTTMTTTRTPMPHDQPTS
jgi:hypothetical protein